MPLHGPLHILLEHRVPGTNPGQPAHGLVEEERLELVGRRLNQSPDWDPPGLQPPEVPGAGLVQQCRGPVKQSEVGARLPPAAQGSFGITVRTQATGAAWKSPTVTSINETAAASSFFDALHRANSPVWIASSLTSCRWSYPSAVPKNGSSSR
ncbi:MAG: hypothetical protein M0010_19185 [Actinomycetota bacterium]|nr:hypothetical protein [Actinomycetota bacterium]